MRARLRWLTAPILVAALAAVGCLTASQESRLQTDMVQVREQVFAMQRDTAAVLTRLQELERILEVQGGSSPARFADLEALLRTLTDEVRALGARLDDNTSRMTALSRDVIAAREQYRSLEARLAAALATRGFQAPGPGGALSGPAAPLATDPNGFPVVAPGAGLDPAAPGTEGAAVPLEAGTPSPDAGVVPAGTPPATEPIDEAAQEADYRSAYNDYTRGTFESAILGFREFLRRWPASPLAGRAQYFIGESHFSQQRYSEAAQAFTLTIENYPGSDKIAAAYLKKGLSLLALKQTARGVIQLQHVIEAYPRTEEARIAADRLRQLGLRDR
jgi:tol-pal system protein YbgF